MRKKKAAEATINFIVLQKKLQEKHSDYFVFGHRHLPLDIALNDQSKYINLGDWIGYYTYAVFEDDTLTLKEF
jgi:UDP-2,3-diacylglucosamine hydrolase